MHHVSVVLEGGMGVDTYGMDFDAVLKILGLDGLEQAAKPLHGAKVSDDPEEVNLPQTSLTLRIVHPIPDRLQDTGKRRDTNTCTTKNCNFILEDVLGC